MSAVKSIGLASKAHPLTRRHVLTGLAAVAAAPGRAALAATSPHSFRHGEFDVSVISDGHLVLPPTFVAPDAPAADRAAALATTDRSGDQVVSPTNCTLIRRASEAILIDAGSGAHFMPTAGKLAGNLEAAGIGRDKITTIVLTHGHPDHLWGVVDELDDIAFPNAQYVVAAAEWDFWHGADAAQGLPPERAGFVTGARRSFQRIKERVRMVAPGQDITTGLRVLDTRGHTQGHVAIEVAGDDGLLIVGDALTHKVISFAHPDWRPAADHDADQARTTRRRLLDRLATDRTRFIGYHMPYPGIGRAERHAGAYRFVPAA
ncbi:MAG: MBL fold metallo-hydrolase [Proteobacteria bacterium]|nr:MBL fold metallo-hydrolase [Pseudomonadota bacterium]